MSPFHSAWLGFDHSLLLWRSRSPHPVSSANSGRTNSAHPNGSEYQFAHPPTHQGPTVLLHWTTPPQVSTHPDYQLMSTASFQLLHVLTSAISGIDALITQQQEMMQNLQSQMEQICNYSLRTYKRVASVPSNIGSYQSPPASAVTEPVEEHPIPAVDLLQEDPVFFDNLVVSPDNQENTDPPLIDIFDQPIPSGYTPHSLGGMPSKPAPKGVLPSHRTAPAHRSLTPTGEGGTSVSGPPPLCLMSNGWIPDPGTPQPGAPQQTIDPTNNLDTIDRPAPSHQVRVHPDVVPATYVLEDGSVRIISSNESFGHFTTASQAAEDSKQRKEDADTLPPLPANAEGARSWGSALLWTLRGRYWYIHDSTSNFIHVTAMTTTRVDNSRLSDNFLSLILMCASKHKSATVCDAVHGLVKLLTFPD